MLEACAEEGEEDGSFVWTIDGLSDRLKAHIETR